MRGKPHRHAVFVFLSVQLVHFPLATLLRGRALRAHCLFGLPIPFMAAFMSCHHLRRWWSAMDSRGKTIFGVSWCPRLPCGTCATPLVICQGVLLSRAAEVGALCCPLCCMLPQYGVLSARFGASPISPSAIFEGWQSPLADSWTSREIAFLIVWGLWVAGWRKSIATLCISAKCCFNNKSTS